MQAADAANAGAERVGGARVQRRGAAEAARQPLNSHGACLLNLEMGTTWHIAIWRWMMALLE